MANPRASNRRKQVSKAQRRHSVQPTIQQQVIAQQWSGPLPPPAALDQFNHIIPNGADRIITMVENEQRHRADYENKILDARIQDVKRSHWMGWTLTALSITFAAVTAYLGASPLVSVAIVGLPVTMMIQSIIQGKHTPPPGK